MPITRDQQRCNGVSGLRERESRQSRLPVVYPVTYSHKSTTEQKIVVENRPWQNAWNKRDNTVSHQLPGVPQKWPIQCLLFPLPLEILKPNIYSSTVSTDTHTAHFSFIQPEFADFVPVFCIVCTSSFINEALAPRYRDSTCWNSSSSSCVIFLCRRLTCYGPPCLTILSISLNFTVIF